MLECQHCRGTRYSCGCVKRDAREHLFWSASLVQRMPLLSPQSISTWQASHSQRWTFFGGGWGLDPFCKCKLTARLQEDVCDTAAMFNLRWVQAAVLHLKMLRQNPPPPNSKPENAAQGVLSWKQSKSKRQTVVYSAEDGTHNRWNVRRI